MEFQKKNCALTVCCSIPLLEFLLFLASILSMWTVQEETGLVSTRNYPNKIPHCSTSPIKIHSCFRTPTGHRRLPSSVRILPNGRFAKLRPVQKLCQRKSFRFRLSRGASLQWRQLQMRLA